MARLSGKINSKKQSISNASRSSRTSRRKTTRLGTIGGTLSSLSSDRKRDVFGLSLILVGLFSFIGLYTGQQSGFFAVFSRLLQQLAGYASFILPVLFLFAGVWVLFRLEKRVPAFTAERWLGIFLLILNLFTWLHWIAGGGWELAQKGNGGGYLGAVFERILAGTVGDWGGFVVLLAWTLIALALAFNISIPDLLHNVTRPVGKGKEIVTDAIGKLTSPEGVLKVKKPGAVKNSSAGIENSEFEPINEDEKNKAKLRITRLKKSSAKPQGFTHGNALPDSSSIPQATIIIHHKSSLSYIKPPSIEQILNKPTVREKQTSMDKVRASIIEETLASLGATGKVVEIQHGPTFTQFCVQPSYLESSKGPKRVKVSQIKSFAGDLKLALSALSVRVEAPVPGKPYIGFEVPNLLAELVTLREGMEGKVFQKTPGALRIVLGEDVSGQPVSASLANMPHLLIAGATNSGKSVCINSIITCLLLQYSPDQLRLVLVDPKRVEFTNYNGIPHLLTPVVVNYEKVPGILQWLLKEMDSRYHKFQQVKARNIEHYNSMQVDRLPYIVLAIDELADIMMLAPAETETALNRLAQMSRATGIHLIVATQRPSVDIITGKIKANFPARVSFSVVSNIDSRVVIDSSGAEELIGRGDMLFQSPDAAEPKRLQGVFVSDEEIERLVKYWQQAGQQTQQINTQDNSQTLLTIPASAFQPHIPMNEGAVDGGEDVMIQRAIAIIQVEERASISLLQRKLGIGYMRAARLIEKLEEMGIIGKPEPNSGVRPVLIFRNSETKQ